MSFSPSAYLDLSQTAHAALFEGVGNVWEALPRIAPYLKENLKPAFHGSKLAEAYVGPQVYVGPGTIIEPGAVIKGPAWIGAECEVRAGAYIRENVIVGDGCVLGNSCEFKNAVLFNGCQVPHYTYVGDSILGHKAHLGAGVILSNFKLAGDEVVLRHDGALIRTGLRKFGAIVGDRVEVGCKAVLNPGSVIGRGAVLYPGVVWSGVLAEKTLVKNRPQYQLLPVRD
ncbi:MAG: UDP-N-acetylglucosamine diphosphorylase [Verrucomicrobium sp.]|nr:UDP-N-acetylglucosamine diphosphorylase [Verrucomicrobium sp.]